MNRIKRTLPAAGVAIVLAAGGSLGHAVLAGPAGASPVASESISHHASAHGHHAASQGAVAAAPVASSDTTSQPPRATDPEMALKLLGERIVAKDVDGIIALHVREAGIVDFDGTVVRGHEAIRAFYIEFFKSDPVLTVNPQQTVIAGGERRGGEVRNRLATVMGEYSLELTGPDGTRQSFTGSFCDVISEQPNGTWLYVHDNPYPPHS